MNLNALLLHFCGIYVDERLNDLSANEERIIETLYDIDLKNYDELLAASEKLQDIDGAEVVKCISNFWRADSYGSEGIKNIKKIFNADIDLDRSIDNYFTDNDHWRFCRDDSEWLEEFNKTLGCNITADDVTKCISMDYLIDSHAYGPGLCGYFEFVVGNGGDPKLFIEKIASVVEKLPHIDVEDIVFWMAPYIKKGDIDAEKLSSRVDWDEVKKDEEDLKEFKEFFANIAPELSIPA